MKKNDLTSFTELNSEPDVMKYFPNTLSRMESDILSEKIQSFIEKNGWRFGKNHWGQGYAREAAKQALSYAFNTLWLNKVVAFTTAEQ